MPGYQWYLVRPGNVNLRELWLYPQDPSVSPEPIELLVVQQ